MFDRRIDQRIAEVARQQHGVVSRRQLLAAGLSAGAVATRVRHHRLFPVIRGIYSLGPHIDIWGQRLAAVLAAGGDPHGFGQPSDAGAALVTSSGPVDGPGRLVVLSHWSAAHVHGLIDRPPDLHHVTSEGAGSRKQATIRIHRTRSLPWEDILTVRGVPMTSPARTILDSAINASARQVRRLIREAEFRELIHAGEVAAAIRRHPRHPACPIVRAADPRTAEERLLQTPIEDLMAVVVDRLPLADPLSQHPVVGASGRTYRADFAWTTLRLIVETDGRSSHDRSTSFQDDRARDADLAAAGWLTLRFTWLQLNDPARVAATILATASTRTAD